MPLDIFRPAAAMFATDRRSRVARQRRQDFKYSSKRQARSCTVSVGTGADRPRAFAFFIVEACRSKFST